MKKQKTSELKNLKIQTKRKNAKHKEHVDKVWILKIVIIAFIVSFLFATFSESTIPHVSLWVELLILVFFVVIGVLFDMIGVAVTAADITPFNSMAARKIKEAKLAIKLKQNADKTASFCNDVIGDICGVVSGTVGVTISAGISNTFNLNLYITSLLITSLIASIIIGLKALCKSYAINNANTILYEATKIIYLVYKPKK